MQEVTYHFRPVSVVPKSYSSLPSAASTIILCLGLLVTAVVLPEGEPVQIFRYAAITVGLALSFALFVELRAGLRSLIRTDILMLVALYGLTLLEFLFPQGDFALVISPTSAIEGTKAVLLGFAGLAVGRHLVSQSPASAGQTQYAPLTPSLIFRIFLVISLLGYFHMILAVNFDVVEMLRQMSLPRFSQAWARGRLGDLSALLIELGLFIYLIPPIAGVVWAQRNRYTLLQKMSITGVLLITLYYGFAGGTRNVFATFIITFFVAFVAASPRIRSRQLVRVGLPIVALLAVGMYYMLAFRKIGLANYSFETKFETIAVDYNIAVISQLTEVFPRVYDYLGLEVPYIAVIHPIPRVLWPSKPEGLSVGIEDALNATGLTLSATFVGESYIAGGFLGVLLAALILGAAGARWNRVGKDISSNFNLIYYASGFFAAGISMRSILVVAPAILPTLALWLYGRTWLRRRRTASPTDIAL